MLKKVIASALFAAVVLVPTIEFQYESRSIVQEFGQRSDYKIDTWPILHGKE